MSIMSIMSSTTTFKKNGLNIECGDNNFPNNSYNLTKSIYSLNPKYDGEFGNRMVISLSRYCNDSANGVVVKRFGIF